jgi:hypothetical protein
VCNKTLYFLELLLGMPDVFSRYYIFRISALCRRHYMKHFSLRVNNEVVDDRTHAWKAFCYLSGSSFLLVGVYCAT